ncbi:YheC/YheD family protein [Cohnella sp. JJ-181]|uniref:YheC/YheD family protein n=1 Tax=Cohnella rhizoplanae TaxID=2974897 RepID=UPI0022FF7936|nr:YheC/YheD family protein [Cohnella sp. JJ-181]CAI6052475.1 Endospore coat-associated protein YheD [Cohnella sp. JJ-181]
MYGNNKLGKYRMLLKEKTLARHLPPTKLATLAHVRAMLRKYRAVYLKPSHGTGGSGIFKLSSVQGGCQLRHGTHSRVYSTLEQAYSAYDKSRPRKTYLVQMGIPLLGYRRRPFDLRVMVQRNPRREWEATGIVGRLAMPGKVVTNYHSGGRPMPAETLLAPSIGSGRMKVYRLRLEALGLRVSRHMSVHFPRFQAYGIDIGIDRNLKPWIIEVNSRPDKSIFNALSDKRMYRKIMRYGRQSYARAHRAKR